MGARRRERQGSSKNPIKKEKKKDADMSKGIECSAVGPGITSGILAETEEYAEEGTAPKKAGTGSKIGVPFGL